MDNVLVTIFCTSYNHEKYIGRMLSSLLNQKCNFNYEILIHDDASTDATQEIIKSYLKDHPNKIHAILQEENQWSKGINFMKQIVMPYARGKYIAVCEGDDYWIDEYKLDKQVRYMEKNKECTFCFTNSIIENVQNGKKRKFVPYLPSDKRFIKNGGDYNVVEVAKLSFIPACTFLFPKDNLKKMPVEFFDKYYCGDRRLTLYFTALGYAHFIDEPTGCYNYGVEGSAMTKRKTKEQLATEELTFARLYQNIDRFTDFVYTEEFSTYVVSYLTTVFCLQGKNRILSETDLKLLERNISAFCRLKKLVFSCMSDDLFNQIRNFKRRFFV